MAKEKRAHGSSLDPAVNPVPGATGAEDRPVRSPLRPADADALSHHKQLQKLESLALMAGNLAHDFNNYLMAIMGNADLLEQELVDAEQLRLLAGIQASAGRAADLSSQLLAFAGKGRLTPTAVDLSSTTREIVGMLKVALSRRISLRLDLAADLAPVDGDPAQIHQVIMNLVVNAAEAIGDGTGVVTVATGLGRCPFLSGQKCLVSGDRSSAPAVDDPRVYLEVRDDGPGIPAADQDLIFDPFYTTKPHGRGLGLASVLGIVRGHGGQLCVDSPPGGGTAIRVCLPPGRIEATQPTTVAVDRPARAGGTVLVVDDERHVRVLTTRMLRHLGYEVIVAGSGSEALETYRRKAAEIDVVVLDLIMPGMDGAEVQRRLRAHDPAVRVVMTSGYHEADIRRRFSAAGIAGFIQKPFRLPGLAEVLERVLSSDRPPAESDPED